MGIVFKRKDSPYWWVAYKKGNKRVRESSGAKSKTLACEILRQRESSALLSGRHSFPDKKRTVEVFMAEFLEWVEANRRPHTLRSYKTVLKMFSAFLKNTGKGKYLTDINLKLLDDYKRHRLNESKTWTVNNHIIVLKAFFNKADEWSYLEDNPTKKLKPVEVTDSKPIRFLSEEEYRRFMETCKADFAEFFPMFYMLVHTGMRKGELLSLEWDDIDLKNGYIYIRSKEGF